MSDFAFSDSHAFVAAGVAAVATYFWRGFGVAIGGRIDPKGWVFEWFACVAYAVLAALVVRLVVFPGGDLAVLPLPARLGSAVLALAAYAASRRSIFVGCLVGASSVALAAVWLGRSVL
ncbi:MAG: AzlD domain-containing protein [Proteobacteria bacterium]|nr:AzlD domain-containing protein [Pseudomonadota bacterium]